MAVNVVGKYRYRMTSPADSTWVPLIIDIILVGRTKIITLHSSVWVENAIDRDIALRLHVPTTSLVPPSAGGGGGGSSRGCGGAGGGDSSNIAIGPLKPQSGARGRGWGVREAAVGGNRIMHVLVVFANAAPPSTLRAGCYLPLTAVLGGRLFLRPEGFLEASRDVIRLTPNIDVIRGQQVGGCCGRGRGRGVVWCGVVWCGVVWCGVVRACGAH